MDTPKPQTMSGVPPLYGAVPGGINRRWLLGAFVAVPVAAYAAGKRRVARLRWTGTARILAGDRRIEIGVRTAVEPFVRARSDSWLLSDGPTKTRSLIIEPVQGFIERDGKREPMLAAMAAHERQQYGVYGYMLQQAPIVRRTGAVRRLLQPGYPPADLHFVKGRLIAIDYVVPAPDIGGTIVERFTFAGEIVSNGVHWPRVIRIAQDGKPYFELNLTSFEAVIA